MNTFRILSAAALLSSPLLASAEPLASAAPLASTTSQTVSVALGGWIAAQGNLALRDIEDSLRREFRENLPSWPMPLPLPVIDCREQAAQPAGGDAAGGPRD